MPDNQPKLMNSRRIQLFSFLALGFCVTLATGPAAKAQSALACLAQQRSCQDSCGNDRTCVRGCFNEAQACINDNKGESSSRDREFERESDEEDDEEYSQRAPRPSPRTPSAQSTPARPTSVDKPRTSTGRDCVEVTQKPSVRAASTPENATSCDGTFCTQIRYVFEATNICNVPMNVRWTCPPNTSGNLITLSSGRSYTIGCDSGNHQSTGTISYTWSTP